MEVKNNKILFDLRIIMLLWYLIVHTAISREIIWYAKYGINLKKIKIPSDRRKISITNKIKELMNLLQHIHGKVCARKSTFSIILILCKIYGILIEY